MTTVVQRLEGGIGNQLFQVLYAQRMARASGSDLALDLRAYGNDGYGRTPVIERLWPGLRTDAVVDPASARALREGDFAWPAQGPLPFLNALPEGVTHLVLEGYWQDHRVADAASADDLRNRLAAAMSPATRALAERIRATARPTAVHIRRRDYKHHGVAAENYYVDALRWLAARHGALDIHVFSDEPNYTAHFLAHGGIRAQLVNSGDDLGDLFLMAQCRHHVISNSTYSWWGAVLSGSDDVIWPDPWSFVHTASPQLCPPHWRRVRGAVEQPVNPQRWIDALDEEQRRIDGDAARS